MNIIIISFKMFACCKLFLRVQVKILYKLLYFVDILGTFPPDIRKLLHSPFCLLSAYDLQYALNKLIYFFYYHKPQLKVNGTKCVIVFITSLYTYKEYQVSMHYIENIWCKVFRYQMLPMFIFNTVMQQVLQSLTTWQQSRVMQLVFPPLPWRPLPWQRHHPNPSWAGPRRPPRGDGTNDWWSRHALTPPVIPTSISIRKEMKRISKAY